MTAAADARWMARALQLAERGLYTTAPNPRVGCVLVRDGVLVGEGFHRRAGEPHAEPLALAQAGAAAVGATAYVTLEPCDHQGRTPPCTEALIAAGVARVVVAMSDPNPLVAGRGLARLRAAGIAVTLGVQEAAARALNVGFIQRMTQGLPWLRCKLAASLDGRTALASGESRWISSPAARRDVQRLRARSGAILTGIGTVLADDPALTVRLDPHSGTACADWPQPLRVIADRRLRLPPTARLLGLPGNTLVATLVNADSTRAAALRAAGAELLSVPPDQDGGVDLRLVLAALAAREINEVLLECGPTLAGAALRAGLINEIVLYLAPHLLGDSARGLFHLPGLTTMEQRLSCTVSDVRRIGPDLRLTLHATM